MKNLFIPLIIAAICYYGCNNNSTGPNNNTNSNLLFSQDSLVCDYHDSTNIYGDTSNYNFIDSLGYHITSWNYSKIKIQFDLQTNADSISSFWIGLFHNYNQTLGDTGYYLYSIFPHIPFSNSYSFLFNLTYLSNYDFYIKFYLGVFKFFMNPPIHIDFIKLKNIKIYKD